MAAANPQERSVELLEMFGDMLCSGTSIIEIDYWRYIRELEKMDSGNAKSALAILHAVKGNISKSNAVFESAIELLNDPIVAQNYCFVLDKTKQNELYRTKIYELAERFSSKKLTSVAYNFAYRFGERKNLLKFMDMHIKLLSEEEGRCMAEKHREELLSELDLAYSESGCTEEQFDLLATIMWKIAQDHDAKTALVEASRAQSRSYIVDIYDKDPKTIALMNYKVSEAVCMESRLDGCELIGRFSPKREMHTGVSYVNTEQ